MRCCNFYIKLIVCLALVLLLGGCEPKEEWMPPSGKAASAPELGTPFEKYVLETRDNIKQVVEAQRYKDGKSPYIGGYSSNEVADMRSPFQLPESDSNLCLDDSKGAGKGFLLIHGLTDSPFLMRDLADSIHEKYPCSLVRAVLLSGHGTVSGDTLDMKYQGWQKVISYGVDSLQQDDRINEIYLMGFSTGTSLSIKYLQDELASEKISGLIMLSTAVKAATDAAFLAQYVSYFKDWVAAHAERDAARYESFSMNAGGEFYKLTKDIMEPKYNVNVPVLMAVSGDDATVDAEAARSFYCNNLNSERKGLIWYKSRTGKDENYASCENIVEVEIGETEKEWKGTKYKFTGYSHLALTISPDNEHYGVNGLYRNCKSYEGDEQSFNACQKGSSFTVFGEKDIAADAVKKELGYDYWRRATFNPEYQHLVNAITCFVDTDCDFQQFSGLK